MVRILARHARDRGSIPLWRKQFFIYYYSKKLSNSKDGKKKDNKGIKLIKTFIKNMYYLYGKIKGKKDE